MTVRSNWVGQSLPRKEDHRLLVGRRGNTSAISPCGACWPSGLYAARMPTHELLTSIQPKPWHWAGVIAVKIGKDFEHLGPILSESQRAEFTRNDATSNLWTFVCR